jgi:hypothetical protein
VNGQKCASHDEESEKAKTTERNQKKEGKLILMKTKLVKGIIGALLSACALVSLADGNGQSLNAQTLRGSYVFATHGWNIVGGVAVPKAIVERIQFNGDGTLVSPFATVSINGFIIHSSGSVGSYTIGANGHGTLTFTGGPSFDIFVDPSGLQLWMIQTGPAAAPAVFEGTATKVSP